jgi:hypothetical protein
MPANVSGKVETPFPVRGVPGGWRDCWDDPDDSAQLRAQAERQERRQIARVEVLGVAWRAQIAAETPAHAPQRPNRPA